MLLGEGVMLSLRSISHGADVAFGCKCGNARNIPSTALRVCDLFEFMTSLPS